MKDKYSIFGKRPNRLDRLVSRALEPPAVVEETPRASLEILLEQSGRRIGRYELLHVLGEGGMGVVYRAQQDEPVKRQVALKIIKPGMDSKRIIARFEAEKQALALLDHPNIAHVYDGGTSESGRPYFVMEYVDGVPITQFCDRHKLGIEDRLALFVRVCHGVQHAHQKGIIHRDLKPSNILVFSEREEAVPKIIDFGVAKALGQPLADGTLATEDGQLLGTPEYMSPEQTDVANEDIDTRSDIYSLGVLLYVLLAGVLPFDPQELRGGGIEHIRRTIREEDPKTPSTRLTKLGEEAKRVAENRCTEVQSLAKHLRRELEWIPLKAMRKERSERYRSASELADDVGNYLAGVPLIAGPPSTLYRVRKFVRRNRVWVAGLAAVLTTLAAGAIVSMFFAIRAEYARAEAQALSDFLRHSVLESLDPFKVAGKEITIHSVLDAASEDLERQFQGTPMAEAEIRHTIGFAYWSLGLYKQAELHQSRALEIYRIHLGVEHPMTLARMKNLGWVYFHWSRYREAERLFTEALHGTLRVLGEEDAATLDSMTTLLMVYYMQGRFDEAEQLYSRAIASTHHTIDQEQLWGGGVSWGYTRQGRYSEAERLATIALESYRRKQGKRGYTTLQLMRNLGELYWDMGRYNEAERLLREAWDVWRDAWGEEHPETLWTASSLGWLCHSQGQYEEAQSLLDKTLETTRLVVGEAHFVTAQSMHGLGTVYLSQGQYDQAEPLLTNAWKILCSILSEENWATLKVTNTLARLYTVQDRHDEAEQLLAQTLAARQRNLGAEHPDTLETINDFGVLRREQGQYEEAESLLHQALDSRQHKLGPDHPACFESMHELAVLCIVQARYKDAEPLLLEAFHGREAKLGPEHAHTIESLRQLVTLYESSGKPDEAEKWRGKLVDMAATEE